MINIPVFQKSAPSIGTWLFDLDGTLVDSEGAGVEVLHQMASALGIGWGPEESLQRFHRAPMARCASFQAMSITTLPIDCPASTAWCACTVCARAKRGPMLCRSAPASSRPVRRAMAATRSVGLRS